MITFAILALAAALAYGASRLIGSPAIPFLLLAGAALARLTGGQLDPAVVQASVALGLAFLLFWAGLELGFARLEGRVRTVLLVGLTQLLVVGSSAALVAFGLGAPVTAAAYVGLAVAGSSTLVVVRVLVGRGQLYEPFGRLVIGVLLLQDLLIILLLPAAEQLGAGLGAVLQSLGAALGVLALALLIMRYAAPALVRWLEDDPELLLLVALAWLFLAIELGDRLGITGLAGAFLAGLALSRFPVREALRPQLASFADFFVALFFTALGAFLPAPTWTTLGGAALSVVGIVVVTVPVVAFMARRRGLSGRAAMESALLLSQTSELTIVLALQGVAAGLLDMELLSFLTLVTAISMAATPLIATDKLAVRLMRLLPSDVEQDEALPEDVRGHVLILGFGRATRPVAAALRQARRQVVVVDDDPGVLAQAAQEGLLVLRGDAADPELLTRARAAEAAAVVVNVRRVATALEIVQNVRGRPVLVHLLDPSDAPRIAAAGGTPIVYVESAVDQLVEWLREQPAG